jgi:hypothetical protein
MGTFLKSLDSAGLRVDICAGEGQTTEFANRTVFDGRATIRPLR